MIFRLPLTISNAYLILCEQPILVDTGSSGDLNALLRLLAKEGIAIHEVAMIIHTHAHASHTGNTRAIKLKADIPTIIHRNDLTWLENGRNAPAGSIGCTGFIAQRFLPQKFKGIAPEIIFDDEMDLSPFGVKATLIHTPGHTEGSASIVFESGDAIIGDLLRGGKLGGYLFPNTPHAPYCAENRKTLLMNVQRLLDWGVERFHTGMGGMLKKEEVEKWLKKRQR